MIRKKDSTDENAASSEGVQYVERDTTVPTCIAVVEAVAAVSGRDATDLPPLYESVDADALNTLFDPAGVDSDRPMSVSFTYVGYGVRVDRDGVEVRSPETDRDFPN